MTFLEMLQEPDPLLAFLRLEEYYRLANSAERDAVRAGWPFGRSWNIPGLDYSDPDEITFDFLTGDDGNGLDVKSRIEARLTYHSIENARGDFRDNALDLTLCWHVALHAGLDVVRLWTEAAEISDKQMAGTMRGFLIWKPEDKCLWNMGFREWVFKNSIVFEWIGLEDNYTELKPKRFDNWGRALEISEAGDLENLSGI